MISDKEEKLAGGSPFVWERYFSLAQAFTPGANNKETVR
jgi:hypothetical protein